ncbi:MAG TPA: TetR family transcriptional regulator [Stellaceae bacterium]|nr:TetR family transcriptional regulator [Stellaceae bacterium]
MSTKKREVVTGRIVAAALDLLRREGIRALTQPRVAKAAGLRQSHITYYFPARSDLVAAVAAAVAERLLAGFAHALAPARAETLGRRLARVGTPEQTRLLLALVLAADGEKALRGLFRRLTKDVRKLLAGGLERQGIDAAADNVALVHALGVGLAVLDLARGEPAARREARATTALALRRLTKRKEKEV